MTLNRCRGILTLVALVVACSSSNMTAPSLAADIRVTPQSPSVGLGLTVQLTAVVLDSAGDPIEGDHATFESLNPSLVTVNSAGQAHSVGGLGNAIILIAFGGIQHHVQVHVRPRVATLGISTDSITLNRYDIRQVALAVRDSAGQLITDPALAVNGVSSDTNVLRVELGNYLQADRLSGHVTVTFSADLVHTVIPVFVTQIPDTILVTPANVLLASGETHQMSAAVLDLHGDTIAGQSFTYHAAANAVAGLSSSGLVTALGPDGSVTATVQSDSLSTAFGVFVGDSGPGVVLQSTHVIGTPFDAATSPTGRVIVSINSNADVRLGTLPDLGLEDAQLTVGSNPLGVAINHAGTRAYVATATRVAVIDLATNTRLPDLGPQSGGQIASVIVSGDDQHLYVGSDALFDYDLSTGQAIDSVHSPGSGSVSSLALDTVHSRLYVTAGGSDAVSEYTLGATMVAARAFGPIVEPRQIAVSPDGTELYAASVGGHSLSVWNLTTGDSIQSVHLDAPGGGYGLAMSANRIAVTEEMPGTVLLFDRTTRNLLKSIPVGGSPSRPAWNAAGTILVVPNQEGWVDFIR